MSLLEWSTKLSVGIMRIDDQHKNFIKLLNQAHDLATKDKDKELAKMLPEVLDYARVHFSTEEEIFDKYHYPFASEHKIEHLKLIESSIKFYDRAKKGEKVGKELTPFLRDWLENHLKKHDFKYAKYFKDNKIKVE
jgi:hemerythrin-like metal-binding protein